MAVRRYDQGQIESWARTPQGGLRAPAFLTRTGVFEYLQGDGTVRREYRPAEEVFHPDSLSTLAHAPITDLHPERNGIRIPVTPENFRELTRGQVAEDVRQDGGLVGATLLIQDQDMVLKVEAGQARECSCGYECTLDPTAGVSPQGEIYDVVQRGIRYNHVGLGPPGWGRAGPTVALRLDSGDGIQVQAKDQVMKETIDGKEYTVGTPEWAAAWKAFAAKEQARADGLAKDLTAAKVDPKVQEAAIQRRVKLITDCKFIAGKLGFRLDEAAASGMSEGELIAQAVKQMNPAIDLNGKSPDYIAGVFATLIAGLVKDEAEEGETTGLDGDPNKPQDMPQGPPQGTPGGVPEKKQDSGQPNIFQARQGTAPRQDGGTNQGQGQGQSNQPPAKNEQHTDAAPDPDAARKAMVDRGAQAWKQPLASSKDQRK